MFYALETYCENLEDALVPHLPVLMERLFETLRPENTANLRKLSMSCVSSAAKAAKSQMLPYFQHIIEVLKLYLVQSEDEDVLEIRPTAIDTLAALARTIGKENFMPLTGDTMKFALTLLDGDTDAELRTSKCGIRRRERKVTQLRRFFFRSVQFVCCPSRGGEY